jgi:hypothetical protein
MAADMVLFDDAIDDRATFDTPTLLPTGVERVWVAGQAMSNMAKAPAGCLAGSWLKERKDECVKQ